ncbi:HAMP domain-containing histidine kinase [Brevibacillus humidisoli]|uniref:two-component system sensor histidine kinase NtrB n=1 Tax=Brevibacillus humidisoli TaxID=2895522 RepID=UPI001E62F447|nr:HAMP domain-containing sensor histidine kinase [Brevibacillus humidisoli]UFJ42342.1 HAMP domain-containing histidine kinase [Brevibacillus humidisoli]
MEREYAKKILLLTLIERILGMFEKSCRDLVALGGDYARYVQEYGEAIRELTSHALESAIDLLFATEEEYDCKKREYFEQIVERAFQSAWSEIPYDVVLELSTKMRVHFFNEMTDILQEAGSFISTPYAYEIFRRLNEIMELLFQHYFTRYLSLKEEQIDHLHEQKISVIGHMAAGMAHELRNPLTSFQGFLQLMEESIKQGRMESTTFLAYIRICREELKALQDLLSSFLVMARKRQGSKKDVEVLPLKPILQRVHDVARHFALEKDVTLLFDRIDSSVQIRGVSSYIEQIGLNIVKNAVDAVAVGGQVVVETEIDPQKRMVQICFADDGPGMRREQLERIFEPFYTTKERGTGLGLAICRQLVLEMAGTIQVDSQPGHGTRVIVELPISD